ncbi:MAG: DNA mismatch repair endonuclease MutL [Alistipes sp.]|nr:DNA mismatch repair endonuclease MutL [Alistipes sp.]
MSDRIKVLPEIVANQIKAGEVVEYPSSAIKEMMENAIDAGASSVKVNFSNGGRDLIQIIDDGCGMSPTDARMAFECHATSKIGSLDDIYALHTFGFRGEALASIAAVSQVELTTRQADAEIGTKTIINGGEFIDQKPVAAPIGSQFVVRNIFYNTPARRKFIDNKESKLTAGIKNEFRRVALCHPEVALELMTNGAPIYSLPKANLAERIVGIFGSSIKHNLLEVGVETTIAKVEGYVGRPSAAKLRSNEQYMFVNGRFFHSPYLNKAVLRAYDKLIPDGAAPSFFIYLTINPERIDVNVHAKKTEVKFADSEAIWQILNAAVRETLAKTGAVPLMDFDNEAAVEIPVAQSGVVYHEPRATTRDNYNPFLSDVESEDFPAEFSSPSVGRASGISGGGHTPHIKLSSTEIFEEFDSFDSTGGFEDIGNISPSVSGQSEYSRLEYTEEATEEQYLDIESSTTTHLSDVRYIGSGYAMMLCDGSPAFMDLKRAHERILFETYMAMLDSGATVSQKLLFPEILTLSSSDYATLEEYDVDIASLGFDMELKGEGRVELNGIPADTTIGNIDQILYELIQALSTPESLEGILKERMATTLAHSEASRRRNYTQADAEAIAQRLQNIKERNYTPSGKAIMVELSINNIEKMLR